MELQPATPEQIAEFKLAAAQTYASLGIEPKVAQAAFDAYLTKIGSEMGLEVEASSCGTKHSKKTKATKKKKK